MSSYNCVIVGDEGVGKRSYLQKLTTGKYSETTSPSLRAIEVKKLVLNSSNVNHEFIIWNPSSEAGKSWLSKKTTGDLDIGIVCFDLNNRSSLYKIFEWAQLVQPHVQLMVLLGLKSDLTDDSSTAFVHNFVSQYKAQYFELSTKNNQNLNSPWVYIVSMLSMIKKQSNTSKVSIN